MDTVWLPSLYHCSMESAILQALQLCAFTVADAQGLQCTCRAPLRCQRRALAPQRGPAGERLG